MHLDLEVAPDDRGRVIGRGGRTADALRTLLDAVGRPARHAMRRGGRRTDAPRALRRHGRHRPHGASPQGRKGEVLVEPLSDRPDRFPTLRRAFVPGPDGAARAK